MSLYVELSYLLMFFESEQFCKCSADLVNEFRNCEDIFENSKVGISEIRQCFFEIYIKYYAW